MTGWTVNLELSIFGLVFPSLPTFDQHPVCGIGCVPLRQGADDREVFAVEGADRRDQSEDEMYCGA
jgi:hypothetical protein